MRLLNLLFTVFFCVALAATGAAQTLPAITLQPVLAKLQTERPVWMCEAPDGSGRLFVVYQAGTNFGGQKRFRRRRREGVFRHRSRDPKAGGENECGLLSLAFHPGFVTNQSVLRLLQPEKSGQTEYRAAELSHPQRDQRILTWPPTIPTRPTWHPSAFCCKCRSRSAITRAANSAFGPDGYLYLGLGDGGNGRRSVGQRPEHRHVARQNAAHWT